MNDDLSSDSFAKNGEEAEKRFKSYEHFDPFPWIPPALLNSADIYKYVRTTGMIFPFEEDFKKNKLKSASYEIDFLGEVYYWKDTNKENYLNIEIKKDDPFIIPRNSIVFVSPQTTFRLPDYIALRFNLRIKHVHRGLLLGTGPLVDPGFEGRLFIPLHNLTSEDYTIIGGEGLIWVEFTKLSPHDHWVNDKPEHPKYNHFPISSKNRSSQQYLNAASKGEPARSSIPLEVEKAKVIAEKASEKVKKFTTITMVSAFVILFGLATLIYETVSLILDANNQVIESKMKMSTLFDKQTKSEQKIESLEAEIKSLTESVELANKEKSVSTNKNVSKK